MSSSSALETVTARYTNNVQAPKDVTNFGWIVPVAPWAAYFESIMTKNYRYVKLNWMEVNIVPNNKFGHPSQIVAWVDDCTTVASVTSTDGGLVTMTWSQARFKSPSSSSDGIRLRCSPNSRWMSNQTGAPPHIELINSMAELGVGWFGSAALETQTVAQVAMVINITLKDPTGFDKLARWGPLLGSYPPIPSLLSPGVVTREIEKRQSEVSHFGTLASAPPATLAKTPITTHLFVGGVVSPSLKTAFTQKVTFHGHVDDQKVYGSHVVEPVEFQDAVIGNTPGILYNGSNQLTFAEAFTLSKPIEITAFTFDTDIWVVKSCSNANNCDVSRYVFPSYTIVIEYARAGKLFPIFSGLATDTTLDNMQLLQTGDTLCVRCVFVVTNDPVDFPQRVVSGVYDGKDFTLPRITIHGTSDALITNWVLQ